MDRSFGEMDGVKYWSQGSKLFFTGCDHAGLRILVNLMTVDGTLQCDRYFKY